MQCDSDDDGMMPHERGIDIGDTQAQGNDEEHGQDEDDDTCECIERTGNVHVHSECTGCRLFIDGCGKIQSSCQGRCLRQGSCG